jgi:hypothetical protein
MQPENILQELATKQSTIQTELEIELKKVEEECGDWESTFGENRCAVFKHNYEAGKKKEKLMLIVNVFR